MILPPDFVCFDCDGVLVDSERITARVFRDNLSRHGLQLSSHQIEDLFVGGTIANAGEKARAMGAELPEDWVPSVYAETFAALDGEVAAIPGIFELLDSLDASGIGYAVCSNGPHDKMDLTLGQTGLMPRFAGRIYSRLDVPNPKPAPDMFLKAAEDAGVRPERCVVVEDSANGASGGKAAGMHVMGFTADTPAERLAPHCNVLFNAMSDLHDLMGLSSNN